MRIGIINIGDELLSGKILNTNQFELAKMLAPLGHEIPFSLVIGDEEKILADALRLGLGLGQSAWPKVDALVLTGGLGPTQDDLTRQAVAAFLGTSVSEDPQALQWLCDFLRTTEAELPWGQRIQAAIPGETQALRNPAGTACGFTFRSGGVAVYAFPGVPSELDAMARLHLLPALASDRILLEKTLWTWGWSEGAQRQALQGMQLPEPFRFSSLPNERGVRISISCHCPESDRRARQEQLEAHWRVLLNAIPAELLVDGEGATLPQAVQKLLSASGATVTVAESCTGGGLGFLITETPGSSKIFQRGFLTYSDEAKIEMLGVGADILKQHGAVSEAAALAMAEGCLLRSGSDYACAITGIAGPEGGTPDKPVGTVWIAVASKRNKFARRFNFRGDRNSIRWRSAYTALNQLRLLISGRLG